MYLNTVYDIAPQKLIIILKMKPTGSISHGVIIANSVTYVKQIMRTWSQGVSENPSPDLLPQHSYPLNIVLLLFITSFHHYFSLIFLT